ncbi:MAG TPA: histidine phosphatase family protein [Beijerinckiaceae bacterium]|nr:histidine phosphatase family protein [Beijerinckiaceae bacterium]
MLLRHAKSAWPDGTGDLERPLAGRGREAAPRMGAYLAGEQLIPDLVLVSPARRTQETWALVRPHLGDAAVRTEPRIYEAPAERLLAVARETDAGTATLLIVGHNPGLADLLRLLVGGGDRLALTKAMTKYPTAGLAVIDLPNGAWRELSPRSGRLDRFVTPKSLGLGEDD